MCGRFYDVHEPNDFANTFKTAHSAKLDYKVRYNIAPTQSALVVRDTGDDRELQLMRWGLIPHWAKDTKIGGRLINARAETVSEKPMFRSAYHARRLIVPASGFYEWK